MVFIKLPIAKIYITTGKMIYEYNFRVAYKLGSWVPFVEVGNVSSGYNTTTTDDRQTRYRVGLGYNF